ncbi:hypothetical protein IIE18_03525 [Pseudomonas sp. V1]|uniref:hypothetical protein n=1 Tax=Pseudomonas arcuscaelestis TaxID=2710591 RepID=UPI00193FD458|nr:hypothetical protein [Pseudomonas arcuscaelestis]MBM3104187.1 hypothetical protein [Pseudomonas arcuscaelestis]
MKLIVQMTALAAAAYLSGSVTAATQVEYPVSNEPAQLMLAEGGSDRLTENYLQRQALAKSQPKQDSGATYVQLIKENPTASGNTVTDPLDEMNTTNPRLTDPITRDRDEYRSAH